MSQYLRRRLFRRLLLRRRRRLRVNLRLLLLRLRRLLLIFRLLLRLLDTPTEILPIKHAFHYQAVEILKGKLHYQGVIQA